MRFRVMWIVVAVIGAGIVAMSVLLAAVQS
jgi:hypothetical protein